MSHSFNLVIQPKQIQEYKKKKKTTHTSPQIAAHYSLCRRISHPGRRCVNAFWSKLMKKWWGGGVGNPALCVVSDLWWAGKTRRDWDNIIPPHRHRVCHEVWMWVEKKNGRQGGVGGDEARSMCVSTGSSSFLLHPFTFLHRGAKKKEKEISLCVCVRACVCD